MEEKILGVISQVKAIKAKPGRKEYPEPLRQEILALYLNSKHRLALAKRLGVGTSTILTWRREKNAVAAADTSKVDFKAISISNKVSNSPKLILSNGLFVENLSEEFFFKVLFHAFSK